jgi:pilus assembly protein Flp/PilA
LGIFSQISISLNNTASDDGFSADYQRKGGKHIRPRPCITGHRRFGPKTDLTAPLTKKGETMKKLIAFFKDDEGATAVEYGIMVAAIAAVIIGTVIWVGNQTHSGFTSVNTSLTPLVGSGATP